MAIAYSTTILFSVTPPSAISLHDLLMHALIPPHPLAPSRQIFKLSLKL